MYKQVIVVRKDLKLPKGKLCVQVAHASVSLVLNILKKNKKVIDEWIKEGMKKVVVKVNDLNELMNIYKLAKKKRLYCAIIKDAGRTVLKEGTITCIGIGPNDEKKIDEITKDLKLL